MGTQDKAVPLDTKTLVMDEMVDAFAFAKHWKPSSTSFMCFLVEKTGALDDEFNIEQPNGAKGIGELFRMEFSSSCKETRAAS